MTEFSKLEPPLRAIALVGGYLQHWAVMESSLNTAIGKALGLDTLSNIAVCKNLQLRDKVKILRTLIDRAYIFPEERAFYLKKVVQRVSDLSTTRNMIAHDMFMASENSDGVTFFVVKAAGKLEFIDNIWSIDEFVKQYDKLRFLTEELDDVAEALVSAERLKSETHAIRAQPNRLLGVLDPLPDLPPPPLNSADADDRTNDETTKLSDPSPQFDDQT